MVMHVNGILYCKQYIIIYHKLDILWHVKFSQCSYHCILYPIINDASKHLPNSSVHSILYHGFKQWSYTFEDPNRVERLHVTLVITRGITVLQGCKQLEKTFYHLLLFDQKHRSLTSTCIKMLTWSSRSHTHRLWKIQ